MNLPEEKFEVSKIEPDNDDLLKEFYEDFADGVHEVKLSLDGKVELKSAETWLNEL